jgi:hypothetical protein
MVPALPALLSLATSTAVSMGVSGGPPAWPSPAVSFWYDATNASTGYDASDGAAMLAKVAAHKGVITSVILFCGITVAPGGKVVGTLSDGCTKTLIPGLLSLGVRVEGTVEAGTCDIKDYRALFAADPQPLAELAVGGQVIFMPRPPVSFLTDSPSKTNRAGGMNMTLTPMARRRGWPRWARHTTSRDGTWTWSRR